MLVKTCKRQKAKQTLKIANFGQKFNCPQYNIIQSLGQHFDGRKSDTNWLKVTSYMIHTRMSIYNLSSQHIRASCQIDLKIHKSTKSERHAVISQSKIKLGSAREAPTTCRDREK